MPRKIENVLLIETVNVASQRLIMITALKADEININKKCRLHVTKQEVFDGFVIRKSPNLIISRGFKSFAKSFANASQIGYRFVAHRLRDEISMFL